MELAAGKAIALENPIAEKLRSQTRVDANFVVIATAILAAGLKALIALRTLGTNDVATFYQFAHILSDRGLKGIYEHSISFNHPPLTAYFLEGIYWLDHHTAFREYGFAFPFWLRLPGILADLVVVLILCRVSAKLRTIPAWALLLFAISPVSVMVSGFHGNTDSVMIMFLVLAVYACARERPIFCGVFFALSCQIKIIPLLFLPIFFLFWLRRAKTFYFGLAFVLLCAAGWAEPLLNFPLLFSRNVLSYGSWWGVWGITYWLRVTTHRAFNCITYLDFPPAEAIVVNTLKALIIVGIFVLAWRRRSVSPAKCFATFAYAWLVFFALSPGVCVQYLVWIAPFSLFISAPIFALFLATSTLFAFFFYYITADGFPWYFASSTPLLIEAWPPWALWFWAAILLAIYLHWREALLCDSGFNTTS